MRTLNPRDRARAAMQKFVAKANVQNREPATLGWQRTATNVVIEVDGKPNHVYITKNDSVFIARNDAGVPHNPLLPVLVELQGNTYVVVGRDMSNSEALINLPGNPFGVPSHPLSQHSDVELGSPGDGFAILWNDADGKWVADDLHIPTLLDDLTDVEIIAPSDHQFLMYEAGDWVNTEVDWGWITGKPSTFAPSAHASNHQHGGSDEVATATPANNAIPKANGSGKLADGWINALWLALAGGTMTGPIAMGTSKITGLGDPTAAQDAATKAYVDAVAQGLDAKASVRAATTANITLSGAQTIDGVSVIAGDRVLVKDQSTGANNGIYVAAAGAWARADDANISAEVTAGLYVFVSEGTTNGNNGYVLTTDDPITLGTTALTFTQFSGAGQITAGNALSKTGNQLDWVPDGTTLEVSSDQGRVKDAGITNAKLANMVEKTVKGRAAAAGTGAPTDLTADQIIAILNTAAASFSPLASIVMGSGTQITLASGGLVFTGAGDGSLTRLDDDAYTPAITGSSSNPTVTYSTQDGQFLRINGWYFFNIQIVINTISGGSGNIRISLPATSTLTANGSSGTIFFGGIDIPGTPIQVTFNPSNGNSFGHLIASEDNAGATVLQISALAAGDNLNITGFYR